MSFSLTAPLFLFLCPVLLLPLFFFFFPKKTKIQTPHFFGTVPLLLRSVKKTPSYYRLTKLFLLLLRIFLLAALILALTQPFLTFSSAIPYPISVNIVVPDIHIPTPNYPSWALESNNQSNQVPRFSTTTFPLSELIFHLDDSNSIYFFSDISTLTPEQADLLIHVWKTGKGLIISFDPHSPIESWNSLFFARLFQSALLLPPRTSLDSVVPTFLTKQNNDFLHPLLQPFQSQSSKILFPEETSFSIFPDPSLSPILYNFKNQPLIYVSLPFPQSQKPLVLFLTPTLSGPFPLSSHFLPLLTESVLWVHQQTTTTMFSLSPVLLILALFLFFTERYCQHLWFSATLHKE
ncbi:MAG: BatA domain-containing protein [Thermoguttaceae bacterium]